MIGFPWPDFCVSRVSSSFFTVDGSRLERPPGKNPDVTALCAGEWQGNFPQPSLGVRGRPARPAERSRHG